MVLHAVTSRPMMTKYDPWVNMLRTCVAAFAAGVGGADAVTVLPFDARLGLPDAFGRRIARNTSTLLVEESHVAKVADPAGGAFAVEKLTDDLAVAGVGGARPASRRPAASSRRSTDGSLRSRASTRSSPSATSRSPRGRGRSPALTEFPNLHETLPERAPYAEGALPVPPYGEAVRAAARRAGRRRKVFLATMGTVAAHTARATFAANLFAAGGIDVVNAGRARRRRRRCWPTTRPDGGQPVVCLVGHDKAYAAWGADLVARAARGRAPTWVVLAGKPVDGVRTDDTCAMGVDALDFLRRTREKLLTMSRSPRASPDLPLRRRGHRAGPRRGRPRAGETGSRPRASASCRSTAPSTSRASTRWTPTPGSRRSCAGPTRRCTPPSRGRCASTPGSPPPRSPTPSTAATSPPARRGSASPSTWPPTAATTPTTRG